MLRSSIVLGTLIVGVAVFVGSTASQEKKDKLKGFLPPGFKDLSLSAAQTEKIYTINSEYKKKIDDLNKQVNELKGQLKKAQVAVLTDEQKQRYTEYVLGEASKVKKKEEKKKTGE
jgi:hypothetical protein